MVVGDIVRHPDCGEGRVIEIDARGATVVFWRNGLRKRPAVELTVIRTEAS